MDSIPISQVRWSLPLLEQRLNRLRSLLTYLGPSISMIMLDCRAERTLNQVCSETTYRRVFGRLRDLPNTVKHLVVQIGKCAFCFMEFI
jgi:hypothetical protein